MQEETKNLICLNDNSNEELFGKPEKYDYSKYTTLKDIDFDEELIKKFRPIAQKLNLSQSSFDALMDIALEMSQKQNAIYEKDDETKLQEKVREYNEMLTQDTQMPSQNSIGFREYMKTADLAFNTFASQELKELFKKTGLIYHPELIKMFNKIGTLAKEDALPQTKKPAVKELTPAEILYGRRDNN